jgi:hypothetical protein
VCCVIERGKGKIQAANVEVDYTEENRAALAKAARRNREIEKLAQKILAAQQRKITKKRK